MQPLPVTSLVGGSLRSLAQLAFARWLKSARREA
jgi:hypothetical protein